MADQKPPLTIGKSRAGSDANLPPTTEESSTGDLSHGPRELKKRRMSSTPQLIVHGNKVELTVTCNDTLCDKVLFLDDVGDMDSLSSTSFTDDASDHENRHPATSEVMEKKLVPALEMDTNDKDEHQLKRPEPVRSDSVSSIPALHHPHPVRSDSVVSIHSIDHAHQNSESSLANAENEVLSSTSIPSLHHGRPLRDEPSLTSDVPLRDDTSLSSFGSVTEKESREPELLRQPSQDHRDRFC